MEFFDIYNYKEIKPSPNGKFPDCWYWTRSRNKQGYGHFGYNGKIYKVHRVVMSLERNFDILSKFEVCHACDNPPCFNPNHLFIGDHKKNMADALEKKIIIRNKYGRFGDGQIEPLLSLEEKKLVYEMIDLKISQTEIAKSLGVSRTVISNALKARSSAVRTADS